MKHLYALILLLILTACNASKEQIRKDASIISTELSAAKVEQETALEAVKELEAADHKLAAAIESLKLATKKIAEALSADVGQASVSLLESLDKNLISAHSFVQEARTLVRTSAGTVKETVSSTLDRIVSSQEAIEEISVKLDGVENKPDGFFVGITSFLKKFVWWIVIIGAIVLVGGLGLWPVVMQGLINFMSSGFMLFRRPKETAKLLLEAREEPSTDKIDNAITHFRTSTVGEAAWRHEKRRRRVKEKLPKGKPG